MMRPKFDDLSLEVQTLFGNGLGPAWFPDNWRTFITKRTSRFFQEASWRHHDFGYTIGYRWHHKLEYDAKFLSAMLRDAVRAHTILPYFLAIFFYLAVTLFGWGSFHFGSRYRSLKEAVAYAVKETFDDA